jgi:hypothetical protein
VTPEGARNLTVTSLVVTGVLASVHDLSQGHLPRVRVALGLGVTGAFLFALADVDAGFAGAMAGLLMASSLVFIGSRSLAEIQKGLTK